MKKETYILSVDSFNELKINSWAGALQTLQAIEEKGKEEELLDLINDLILNNEDERIEECDLNDFLWFDTDYIEEYLNCKLWED